jgi:pimeloyl-ACP methyl ester carboxylesterase
MTVHDHTDLVPTRLGPLAVRQAGSGPPALLWHSLFVDSTSWQRLVPPLAVRRRLVLVDGPGHGGSPGPKTSYTLDDCAAAARDVLDALGIDDPVDWLGNAWGGHVGIPFAAAHPDRIRSLVAVGTPVHRLAPGERGQMTAGLAAYRVAGPVGPLLRVIERALLGSGAPPADARVVSDAVRRADRRGLAQAIRSVSLDRPDLTRSLPSVRVPTLLVAAASDPGWTPAQAAAAARLLPRGAATTVPGAGHVAPLLQDVDLLTDLVTHFWTDPAGSGRPDAGRIPEGG